MDILGRVKKVWNAFTVADASIVNDYTGGIPTYSSVSPARTRPRYSNERSIISSIYTRIAIDVSSILLRHVKLDDKGRYTSDVNSRLNSCLTLQPNIDQGPRQFRQDYVMTLFDKGVAAVVPVDTSMDPTTSEVVDIFSLRVGEIVSWHPKHVRVNVYNEEKGIRQEVVLEKKFVAIVENPLFSVMNEPNSTLQRLIRKLNLLDTVDEATGSGKLDLIIQLPYVIKSEARRDQAEKRRQDIEFQLKGSQYGIAYTDGTEKITQLNRPTENNLLKQIEYLTALLYGQLGITTEVMNGTASEEAMRNYFARTIEPIVDALVEAMQRSFLGYTGTSNGERIFYFNDIFKLVPVAQIAEIADKFTRNEIMTGNEIRGLIGIPPAIDPKADQLRNSNMPIPDPSAPVAPTAPTGPTFDEMDSVVNQLMDGFESQIDEITKKVGSG